PSTCITRKERGKFPASDDLGGSAHTMRFPFMVPLLGKERTTIGLAGRQHAARNLRLRGGERLAESGPRHPHPSGTDLHSQGGGCWARLRPDRGVTGGW